MHGIDTGGFAYGLWTTVLFSVLIVLFLVFSFVKPKKKAEWRSMGLFAGFIVALFTEMYGIPLTIYFITGALGQNYPVLDPFSHSSGHLVLVFLGLSKSITAMTILHLVTNAIIFFWLLYYLQGMETHTRCKRKRVGDSRYLQQNPPPSIYRNVADYCWISGSMAHNYHGGYVACADDSLLPAFYERREGIGQ